ncbi:MAG: PEGA domain-containing protein [Bacteroidetes bacterium]|nr:PEGA domain-containing protein [Bacteroidota bacterium]
MSTKKIIVIFLAFFPFWGFADEFEVKDFKKDASDLSTQRNPRKDIDGEYCALIKVSTDIQGASFISSQGNCGNTTYSNGEYRVYVSPGERRLEIFADGFAKKYYNFPLPIEASSVYQMVLVRNVTGMGAVAQLGMVLIKSNPTGADVFINNNATGKTTPFQQPFEAGIYRYTLKKDMYHELTGEFTILPDQTTTIEKALAPDFGSLYVETTPESGAIITIDGREEDQTTPATIEPLSPGNHTLSVRMDMYETVQQEFSITKGEITRIPITMNPTFALISINTDSEAEIFINNESLGKGSFLVRLIEGTHIIEVKKDKHYSEKQTLNILAGEAKQLTIDLKPITGTLIVRTKPPEALVTIDGVDKGKSPLVINNIIIGSHYIKLQLAGYQEEESIVEVLENQTTEIDETLKESKGSSIMSPAYSNVNFKDCNGIGTDRRDGQQYKVVKIGNQCWMAENLKFKMYNSWCYENKKINCEKYGRLYDWAAAMRACPEGWHLPSDKDWSILIEFMGNIPVKKLTSTSDWNSGGNGTDDYGFSVLPGGYRSNNDAFNNLNYIAYFWSSTELGTYDAWYRELIYDSNDVHRYLTNKANGFSVRCLRD